ncbi:MAG: ROK family protein [Nocardioides sp.]|uniref:ROK family protein n=1 Tax=Nocardioides sp. TaxID=35761 RepID=UPI0039E3B5B9
MAQTESMDVPEEFLDALVEVLDVVRDDHARTRPDVGRLTKLGRGVVAQRVSQLLAFGLLAEDTMAASTGGRPARSLRFRAEAGVVIAVELGASSVAVGLADLRGGLLDYREEPADIGDGPEAVLERVEALADELLEGRPAGAPPVWGVGVGLPGPVEYRRGRPMSPPIMPGWDGYPVRERLAARFGAPTWVDNDVNLMAVGEYRAGRAQGEPDVVFIKIGTGIGAGLISRGLPHRGAQGAAGDVGHIAVVDDPTAVCRCGKIGCLEAVAGGAALARFATELAESGDSPYLARLLKKKGALSAEDLGEAASHGDVRAVELFERTATYIGRMLATMINFFNPSLVIIGGGVAQLGDQFLAAVRQSVYSRSLPLATRDLKIVLTGASDRIGLVGAAYTVIDELFSRDCLSRWLGSGSPAGHPDLTDDAPAIADATAV